MLPLAALLGPIGILTLSIGFIVAAIALFRLHAFFALMLAASLVAVLSAPEGPHRWTRALAGVTRAFGATAGDMGLTLALAAVIGISLMESGAADRIVRSLIAVCGERYAAVALLLSGFFLSAPVFVDTVMLLLLPLARALSLRTGKRHYLMYVLATVSGAIITNGTVPPAPGPLYVAGAFRLNLALVIVAGALFGAIPAAAALLAGRWFDRRMPVEPRAAPGASLQSLEAEAARPDSELPGLAVSVAPVLIPFVLIAAASTAGLLHAPGATPRWLGVLEVLGAKNVALFLGAVAAVALHARHRRVPWSKAGTLVGPPLEMAAMIILIICAGSAYGASINRAGLGEAVRRLAAGHSIDYVILGWGLSALVRGAQGSATVAVITAAGIVTSIAGPAGYGISPIYVLLAIGYGSKALSWMNDAGFWLVCRVGGLTQSEALRSWSVLATGVSVIGLLEVWVVSRLWPAPRFGF
jgi:GntP family gluconate:H+ symporter